MDSIAHTTSFQYSSVRCTTRSSTPTCKTQHLISNRPKDPNIKLWSELIEIYVHGLCIKWEEKWKEELCRDWPHCRLLVHTWDLPPMDTLTKNSQNPPTKPNWITHGSEDKSGVKESRNVQHEVEELRLSRWIANLERERKGNFIGYLEPYFKVKCSAIMTSFTK